MRRHLFFCTTPFQIMMAVAFKMTILEEEIVDIIVSDIIFNSETLYKNIEQSNFFNKVYYIKNYQYDYSGEKTLIDILRRKKIVESLIPDLKSYENFYITDTLPSMDVIYELLLKKNKNLKLFYFEEGPIAVLCDQGNHFKVNKKTYGIKSRLISLVLGKKYINGNFCGAYSTVYDQMPPNYFTWHKLPIITGDTLTRYVDVMNLFWNYKHDNSLKDKVIFLEESFYVDNRGNNDMEIIDDIIEVVGAENVLVKLHPRTRHNRFEQRGIITYNNISVPWELIALNGDLDNTILISVGSGALLYPNMYWGIHQQSIALVDCKEYRFDYLNNDYYNTYSNICKKYFLAKIPVDKNEFKNILRGMVDDGKK